MAAIHCYSVANYIHFTQQRRVYYSQKQIGFRSSTTCTFKKNDKLEIGNVPVNRGLWICCPLIHDGILVNGLDIGIPNVISLQHTTVWPEILAGNIFWRIGGFESNPPIFHPPKLYSVLSSLFVIIASTCTIGLQLGAPV